MNRGTGAQPVTVRLNLREPACATGRDRFVILEGGEDPRFIARRMIVLASEDIGSADPVAL